MQSRPALRWRGFALSHPQLRYGLLGALLMAEVIFLFLYRQVNLDEGWYLWASKLVYEGQVLYRDFAYTQTPLLPYVYGLFQLLFGDGLYVGRVLTVLLAAGAFGLSAATAHRVGGVEAGYCCLALLIVSVFALAQFTYTATYALTAFLLAAAFFISVADPHETRRNLLATLCLATAVGVRLSVAVALPPFLLYLLLTSQRRWRAALVVTATTLIWLGGLLGFFWLQSGELMYYDIFVFHTDRLLKAEWHQLHMYNMGRRTAEDFVIALLLLLTAPIIAVRQLWRGWRLRSNGLFVGQAMVYLTLFVMILALFAVHLLPRTADSYYNALQTPLLCLLGGSVLAQWPPLELPARRHWIWLLIGLVVFAYGARQWRAFQRDQSVVFPLRNQITVVQRAATLLERYIRPGDVLLSFNPHLALESGLRVHPGYEMAIFAYRPTWTEREVKTYHVVNNEQLLHDLRAGVPAAAFTRFDLEQIQGIRDELQRILHGQYRWFAVVPEFGPYGDALNLYLPPQFGQPAPQHVQRVPLAESIQLLGFDQAQRRENEAAVLDVALYWRAGANPNRDYTVFVQLLDSAGALAVGWDNPPCRATCPTTTWQAGEWLRDEYTLTLADLTPGLYRLQAGLYDPVTGQRLAVLGVNGEPSGDRILLGEVTLEP